MRHQHRNGHRLQQITADITKDLVATPELGKSADHHQVDALIGTAVEQQIADTEPCGDMLFANGINLVTTQMTTDIGIVRFVDLIAAVPLN